MPKYLKGVKSPRRKPTGDPYAGTPEEVVDLPLDKRTPGRSRGVKEELSTDTTRLVSNIKQYDMGDELLTEAQRQKKKAAIIESRARSLASNIEVYDLGDEFLTEAQRQKKKAKIVQSRLEHIKRGL